MRETYERGSKELRVRFRSRLKILASLPRDEWNENYHKYLSGPASGLCELRFIAEKVQQRPLGFHLSQNEFVILYWAIEKNDRIIPASAYETALVRKESIKGNRYHAHELWLPLE